MAESQFILPSSPFAEAHNAPTTGQFAPLFTQMYFPGDPFFFQDPIYNSVPKGARERMISVFDYDETRPDFAVGYKFDIVLRGKNETPFETHKH